MRTAVVDTLQSSVLGGIVRHLLGCTRVATIATTDTYGAGGITAFHASASNNEVDVLADLRFSRSVTLAQLTAPAGIIEQLIASGARVIVLFTHADVTGTRTGQPCGRPGARVP
jgi:ABC-type branched-subunit amino acid transport system substrate-binding protein